MSKVKSLKQNLVENLKKIITDSKEVDLKGELESSIEELEGLVSELEEQIEVERIMKKNQ
ncbi:hypothetical protein MASR1M48_16410 [Lactococcus petauri]